nr:transglutaminase-like cysteine peptidase [Limoniibacter endophyticus]
MPAIAQATPAMETGAITSQPIGHYEFCLRLPDECNQRPRDRHAVTMGNQLWNTIKAVNVSINATVEAKSDLEVYGVEEYWAYPDQGAGDCEDYALEKRRALHRLGISLANLLITVVRKPDGEGHAVLTVRTDRGDYVLDNLTDEVQRWDETDYTYLKRQASDHTGRWVTIREGTTSLVGAVR